MLDFILSHSACVIQEQQIEDEAILQQRRDNAMKAKLRRLCEVKKSGKINVPKWLHDHWADKNTNKLELAKSYAATGYDKAGMAISIFFSIVVECTSHPAQDAFVSKCESIHSQTSLRRNQVLEGWYCREDMVKELKWSASFGWICPHYAILSKVWCEGACQLNCSSHHAQLSLGVL